MKKSLIAIAAMILISAAVFYLYLYIGVDGKVPNHRPSSNRPAAAVEKAAGNGVDESKRIRQLAQYKRRHQPHATSVRLSAPFVSQKPELPNGCEVSALTMLLRSAGVSANKMTLAAQVAKVPFSSGGYHGNPNDGFVGNMYHGTRANPGYGVYHGPIAALARKYLGNRVVDLTGSSWQSVERQLEKGRPVWVITSINFVPVPDSAWRTWHTRTGDLKISFQEHAVLLTGYDQKNVYFHNPLESRGGSNTGKALFVAAWKQFGSQAVSYQ
ncbi:MAG: C39 family peptidase [Sporolactobacillus sp.]|jgi:uncharacterized protein YvpB|nr:C39 family peptidase [Sporolactobacillus sp.]